MEGVCSQQLIALSGCKRLDVVYLNLERPSTELVTISPLPNLSLLVLLALSSVWFSSNLLPIKLMVKFEGNFSSEALVMSVVPQGSHLVPLFF